MFFGEYEHAIDEKSRLTLPARFRDALGSGVVIGKGIDANLDVYPRASWTDVVEERLAGLDPFSRETRELQRFFFSGVVDAVPDKQGRVLVPPKLAERAGLEREVVVVGVYDHLEIWDRKPGQSTSTPSKGGWTMLPNVLQRSGADPHVPVLADEVRELLAVRPGETVVDATFGAGGHARLLARDLARAGKADRRSIVTPRSSPTSTASRRLRASTLASFAATSRSCSRSSPRTTCCADAVLLDLGVSSMQIDRPERGFSYATDAPLDMRMDTSAELSARDIVNEWDERELATIFRRYGEERYAPAIARAIVRRRAQTPFARTGSSSTRSRQPSRRRPASARATRPSASSRLFGSRSTTSSARSRRRCRRRSRCCGRAVASP